MYCEVCGVSLEKDNDGVLITERTCTSNVKLLFKLYSVLENTDLSFDGKICQVCHSLVEQVDLLESQLKEVQMSLRERSFLHDQHESKVCIDKVSDDQADHEYNDADNPRTSASDEAIEENQDQVDSSLGPVDTEFSITKTQRKENSLLLYKGYTFRRCDISGENSSRQRWKCANNHFKTNPCYSQAVTVDSSLLLLDLYTEHNHVPNYSKCHRTVLRERIKNIVLNHPNMKTTEILQLAAMLEGNSKKLKDDKSLHRYVQRMRAKYKANSCI